MTTATGGLDAAVAALDGARRRTLTLTDLGEDDLTRQHSPPMSPLVWDLAHVGDRLLATTWGDTLAVLVTADGVAVASEPYDDDPRWRDVPDRSLLTVTASGVAVHDLPDPRGETVAEMENR